MKKYFVFWLLFPILGAVAAGLVSSYLDSTLRLTLTTGFITGAILYFLGYLIAWQDERFKRMEVFTIFSAFVMMLLTAIVIWNVCC
ncbi:hypothetical protein NXS08_03860 [Gleimia sp. 6138-11-ORH1]|uniref:hypothetical protein n=1 Tax=Gleimia sp. 6138-11-ORH1 TaxID=2973937 RepID=UPI002168D13E|nr:hypothetical protein [Gleimia sp. 6138-11-ORH1]MCS4484624.1 hypothetical protein [Gleimia sp. 6138-11-ORH1]